jgi:hypothetical protein
VVYFLLKKVVDHTFLYTNTPKVGSFSESNSTIDITDYFSKKEFGNINEVVEMLLELGRICDGANKKPITE